MEEEQKNLKEEFIEAAKESGFNHPQAMFMWHYVMEVMITTFKMKS